MNQQKAGLSRKYLKFKGVKLTQVGSLSLRNTLHIHALNGSATERRKTQSYSFHTQTPKVKQVL